MINNYYLIKEVVKLAHVSRETIYRDIRKGLLTNHKANNMALFDKKEVERYIELKKKTKPKNHRKISPNEVTKEYYTTNELCELLGLTRATIQSKIKAHKLKATKQAGSRSNIFTKNDIIIFLKNN